MDKVEKIADKDEERKAVWGDFSFILLSNPYNKNMKTIHLDRFKGSLQNLLEQYKGESILIKHGRKMVGVVHAFWDDDAFEDFLLHNHPTLLNDLTEDYQKVQAGDHSGYSLSQARKLIQRTRG